MTKIEWTHRPGTRGETWNPVAGCTKVSAGCDNCYALRNSWRIMHNPKRPARYDGVAEKAPRRERNHALSCDERIRWTGRINIDHAELERPLGWRTPRTVFVCSMSDLFHEGVPNYVIETVWQTMSQVRTKHTFLILTKRPKRMREFVTDWVNRAVGGIVPSGIWLGVTVENQDNDWRIMELLKTPAAVRFVSVEPMLGPVDLTTLQSGIDQYPLLDGLINLRRRVVVEHAGRTYCAFDEDAYFETNSRGLDWVIVGGESGPGARPMQLEWARGVRDQCVEAGVPFFFKQWGEWAPVWDSYAMMRLGKSDAGHRLDGKEWHQWPK